MAQMKRTPRCLKDSRLDEARFNFHAGFGERVFQPSMKLRQSGTVQLSTAIAQLQSTPKRNHVLSVFTLAAPG